MLILSFLFCKGCSLSSISKKKYELTEQEYNSLEKFFRYFFLHEGAIFTILGSKPLTEVVIVYEKKEEGFEENPEELKGVYLTLNRNDPEHKIFCKKLPKECHVKWVSDRNFIYPIDELWSFWENISSRFSLSKKYLLVKKERSLEEVKALNKNYEKIYDVFFVDVFKTALVLQENYDLFKQAVGFDFDPLKVTLELENSSSPFWASIQSPKYSYLWGILYGFGKKNAFSYYWKFRVFSDSHASEQERAFAASLINSPSCLYLPDRFFSKFSITDFPLPSFSSFSNPDPIVLLYKKEKKEIQKLYKGKDFVFYTLELLTERKEEKS
jgi:hypothetical protein